MFFSMNIKLQKIETVLLQTSVGVFFARVSQIHFKCYFIRYSKTWRGPDDVGFSKQKKINFWYYFSGVFYDGEMYKGLISIIDFLKG